MLFGKRKRIVKRILVVEDEPLTAFDNETMLADLGYEVVATLDTFEAAIDCIDKEQVDLIMSDYRLQGDKTGVDLARAAKQRAIPILFATGHQLPPEAAELAVGVLVKPYTERVVKAGLASVDRLLAGQPVKPPRGMQVFPAAES